jgi:hypothetical protein
MTVPLAFAGDVLRSGRAREKEAEEESGQRESFAGNDGDGRGKGGGMRINASEPAPGVIMAECERTCALMCPNRRAQCDSALHRFGT